MIHLIPLRDRHIPISSNCGDFERQCEEIVARILEKRTREDISKILDQIRRIDAEAKKYAMWEIEDIVQMIQTLTPESLENFWKELPQ